MHCRIVHHTSYQYGRPVFLESHLLRLVPRGDAAQRLLSLDMAIRPEPTGQGLCTDAHGNTVLAIWFTDLTDHLDVEVTCAVETLRRNPFDFLPDPQRSRLPVPLRLPEEAVLGACLAPSPAPSSGPATLAARLVAEGAATPRDFLWALVNWLGRNLTPVIRYEPGILAPDTVLARGQGACRDLAVLGIAACRAVGIPARFVSGYQEGDADRGDWDLHAWFEAWLPGGGWRGYDPTHGLAVADRHVTLAAAPDPGGAAPLEGAFRGDGVTVRLSHEVRLEMC